MVSRRQFLKTSSLIGFAPTIPAFLGNIARGMEPSRDKRVLVVIQLDGGNDGINTVVPIGDEAYAKHRRELRLDAAHLHKLDENVSLHQSMPGFAELWNDEQLAVLQGVSYPNPSQSHEVSMSVWQTGRPQDRERRDYGWLGRTLDGLKPLSRGADAVFAGNREKPLALKGRKCKVSEFSSLDDLRMTGDIPSGIARQQEAGDLQQFLTRASLEAYETSKQLEELRATDDGYPDSAIGQQLKMIARLLQAEWPSRVYYVVQPGYDTHSAQLFQHSRLLRELSEGVSAFQKDLRKAKLDERVVTLCFSEFGRRVTENGSAGTDHGTAGPIFVVGRNAKGGLYGETPSLSDLEADNLKTSLDFRQAYATVIDRWLNANSSDILDAKFEPLEFLPE